MGAAPTFEWVPPEDRSFPAAFVEVVPDGPYLVRGGIEVFDAEGERRLHDGVCVLCRCGGSRIKPFCDRTHERIGFDGTETADPAPMADRRRSYPTADGTTIFDDRTRCAHFGQCTDRLPNVFGVDRSPGSAGGFIDPTGAAPGEIVDVVAGCPSGALTAAPAGSVVTIERHESDSIRPIVDGPYRVRGGIPVHGSEGVVYETRERQTLCRCGQSRNKPFCDGSHWYAAFRDPAPAELDACDPYPWTDPAAAARGRETYDRTGHR